MIEYLRARQQQQAMPQRQQMQFGMPPLGANGNASFPHDPSQAIPNSQSHMGGAPSNPNYMQMQALRQNQMFAQNQGGQFNRQLNLMLQQNQESQNVAGNNPMSLLQRQFQQSQHVQQQHTQPQAPLQQHQGMNAPQLPPGIFPGSATSRAQRQSKAARHHDSARDRGRARRDGDSDSTVTMSVSGMLSIFAARAAV